MIKIVNLILGILVILIFGLCRECGHKLSDAEEQLSMFKEMLEAKDHVVMNLTNQLFELEQKDPDDVTKRLATSVGIRLISVYMPVLAHWSVVLINPF